MQQLNTLTGKTIVVITGPTAVGKTTTTIEVARAFNSEIISADSRQFYQQMRIGTAVPEQHELQAVPHHFIQCLPLNDVYNVSRYESDAMEKCRKLFLKHDVLFVTGGSGLYIDALCNGIDELPDPDPLLRQQLNSILANEGIIPLQQQLEKLDPEYYAIVDKANHKRLMRAIEVCLTTGKTYTSQRRNQPKKRPFQIIKIALNRPRPELFERIALRADLMVQQGLIEEAKALLPHRHFNALNTVGYKEIFAFLDGGIPLDQAIIDIKTNTRRYAKRQLTWFQRDAAYHWFHPNDVEQIINFIHQQLAQR